MSLAMKRLKNLGWLALVFLVAILLYPLSLNVAALHSDLVRVNGDILDTQREISFLQAELRTRASMQQLEEWNDLLYGYQPPTAQQFLSGEAALAGLGGGSDMGSKPVMVAVSDEAPAGLIGAGRNDDTRSAPADIVEKPIATPPSVNLPAPEPTRTERLARMDQKLLSDDLMRDISAQADRENRRR
jgi:hypothetical protein